MSYETVLPASVLTLNTEPFPSSSANDSKQISKLILRSALQKANVAVQCDSTNDVMGAINSYKEAILLLERVLSTVDKENDRHRLQEIHDSYSERIRLLSAITHKVDTDKDWLNSKPKYSSAKMIRKMTSSSSIIDHHWESSPPSPSSSSSSVRFVSNGKEKIASSPPILQLQTSKSTPTTKHSKEPVTPIITRPPRHGSRIIINNNSNRSSVSSLSSVDSDTSIVEQPSMALPSLKDTPIPIKKSVFRARTSSLPKSPPSMQRSSSMSTVEDVEKEDTPVNVVMARPIVSRPSVNGSLGSMRKKAANRLSMDGFVSRKTPSYGFILKDQMTYDMTDEEAELEDTGHLKLLLAIEKSMLEGAHITQKLYIPKNLWQQPNIKLSSMDIKVSACESLMNDIARLENWSYLDDLSSSTKLLDNFENAVDHLQTSLSKKLKRESSHAENHHHNTTTSSASSVISTQKNSHMIHSNSRDSMSTISRMDSGKKTQSFMSWGTKLTKSVERMNAFSLTKT
ncbi:uncharacterized protein EV154DRAFT_535727 [Mucor mucedo]|uniref:uncharacterized protein n=1 Tax=Mucor mucedo TaxID=29922 RepID=UPI00221ECC5B|nr:uncharacterized protein EV154DRAFT_535727 [Mucor mucedo]KAI7896505.1 hypothetical protein EV154DRAFT_535727 [Mucor mucedo]